MTSLYFIFSQAAEAAPAAQQQQGGSFTPLLIMLLFIGAMYFFMIAPQRKRQKQHEQMINDLQTGDDIVTIGGIFGKITNKSDKTFTIKVSDNTKIEILKSAVSSKIEEKAANPSGGEAK